MITSTPIQYAEPWVEVFISYIQFKRGLGLQYDRPEYELMALSRFLAERAGNRLEITQETAEAWCQRRDGESVSSWSYRFAIFRQLAIYLNSREIPAYIPLSPRMRTVKYVPCIFTESEILRIYNEADKLELSRQSGYNKIMPEVLRILFSTGLRISEAVNLKITDVDLTDGVLYILESKNLKSRLVPMNVSLTKRLQQYSYSCCQEREYFFETKRNTGISQNTCYKLFRKILFRAGIPHGGRGFGPRLHDTRHTFAVQSLKNMTTQGLDIYTALPYLSAYLGYESIKETEGYLRLTADVYPKIEQLLSDYTGHVVPEV
ncbi:tyrosine-type recombinase/integrase [Acutalibacter intestini]|uniref:tyrosine-type recombinase/integrase n=1 Tax=Acutalibacter intestini TaxID=3093659 RepID=UPI002AC9E2DA|nr:tyrosine-type recombinase/integrase [Acutalibacter sp. M00204]